MALAIGADITRDDAIQALNTSTPDQKAATILELAQRGETEVSEYLDMIVGMLGYGEGSDVKVAVCQAIRAAGSQGVYYLQSLEMLLMDAEPEVVYEACIAIASMGIGAVGAKMAMKPLLDSDKDIVRFGACTALGQMEATDFVEALKSKLQDPSPEVQGAACMALAKLGPSGKACAADVAGKLEEPRSRLQAVYALGMMEEAGEKHCDKLCECLQDDESDVRLAAAQIVGQMGSAVKDNSIAMGKAVALLTSDDGRFRNAAALAMGYMGMYGVDQVDILQEMLEDNFEEPADTPLTAGGARSKLPPACRKTKCAAAAALGMIVAAGAEVSADSIAGNVSSLLSSDDWETRMAGCEALALMGDRARDQSSRVAALFEDEKYLVRAKAAHACGKFRDMDVVSQLTDLVQDPCPSVKEEALLALGELGEDAGDETDKVFPKIMDYSPVVRAAACKALGKMGEKGQFYASAIVQRLLTVEAPIVKVAALEALGAMQEHGSAFADVVAEFLQDPLPSVRAAAAASLGKMGPEAEPYFSNIRALADDLDEDVAKAASEATALLGI